MLCVIPVSIHGEDIHGKRRRQGDLVLYGKFGGFQNLVIWSILKHMTRVLLALCMTSNIVLRPCEIGVISSFVQIHLDYFHVPFHVFHLSTYYGETCC